MKDRKNEILRILKLASETTRAFPLGKHKDILKYLNDEKKKKEENRPTKSKSRKKKFEDRLFRARYFSGVMKCDYGADSITLSSDKEFMFEYKTNCPDFLFYSSVGNVSRFKCYVCEPGYIYVPLDMSGVMPAINFVKPALHEKIQNFKTPTVALYIGLGCKIDTNQKIKVYDDKGKEADESTYAVLNKKAFECVFAQMGNTRALASEYKESRINPPPKTLKKIPITVKMLSACQDKFGV